MKAAKSIIGIVALVLFLIVVAWNSFYTVSETETAVITTFGKASVNNGKGLQFKIPFIQKVKKVDTTIKGVTIGYDYNKDGSTY